MPIFAQLTDSVSPATLGLGAISPMVTNLMIGVFLVISIVMILTVLIQRPQGGGLSGAFGAGSSGGGAGQTAFGTKTGDVLTWATITVFILFVLFAIILNFATRPQKAPAKVPVVTVPADEQAEGQTQGQTQGQAQDQVDDQGTDAETDETEQIDLSGDAGIETPGEPDIDPTESDHPATVPSTNPAQDPAENPAADHPQTTPEDG